jgi:hypothetical protein
MSASRPNIVIATPCYGGLMTHVYVHSLLKLTSFVGKRSFNVGLLTSAHDSLITRSRNALVKSFLDTPTATHLLFIDADIGFEPEGVERLLAFNEDVVAGMYPVKVVDWAELAALARTGMTQTALRDAATHFVGGPHRGAEREERNGFVSAEYAGTGFMLIKRGAIQRLIDAHPETAYRAMQTFPPPKDGGTPFYNLFDCMIDPETGTYLSEDFTFCHRWRKLGGKVWLDTQSTLRHVGSMEFQGRASLEVARYGAAALPRDAAAAE